MAGAVVGLVLREPVYLSALNYYTGLLPLQFLMAAAGTIMYFLLPALIINGLIVARFSGIYRIAKPVLASASFVTGIYAGFYVRN